MVLAGGTQHELRTSGAVSWTLNSDFERIKFSTLGTNSFQIF